MKNRDILKEHYLSELPSELKNNVPKKLDKKFINDFAAIIESNLGNEEFTVEEIWRKVS